MQYNEVQWEIAACKGIDPNEFVRYDYDTFSEIEPEQEFQDACKSCPIELQCFLYALNNYAEGWWGGTSSRHRDRIRRRQRASDTNKED
jgi:hypothetical protein